MNQFGTGSGLMIQAASAVVPGRNVDWCVTGRKFVGESAPAEISIMTHFPVFAFGPSGSELLLVAVPVAALIGLMIGLGLFCSCAKMAGAESCSGGQAFVSLLLGGIVGVIITVVFSLLPVIGTFLGIVCGFLLKAAIISAILRTTYAVGLLTLLLFMVFGVLLCGAIGVGVVVVGGGVMLSGL
jgi:hypothetical protein